MLFTVLFSIVPLRQQIGARGKATFPFAQRRGFSTSQSPFQRHKSTVALSQVQVSDERMGSKIGEGRAQTAMERIRNFPEGVKALLRDCLLYMHIHDTSKTPLNAWTINHPMKNREDVRGFFIYGDEVRPGRIPWRQYEQQRRLRNDIRTMLPLVIIWIPPIIGFLPPILAVMAPRQVMSHHFHNEYEIELFSNIEYRQRRRAFADVGDCFWSSLRLDVKRVSISNDEEDAAGPIFDATSIYSVFADHDPSFVSPLKFPNGIYTSVDDISREYLVKLSLAIGINQYLPGWLSPWIAEFSPSFWLRWQVQRISAIVCHDDNLLLEEGHDLNVCVSLNDMEVLGACLMRGLPTTISSEERRECLTNHLKMVGNVKRKIHGPVTQGFQLFTVHLAVIRHHMKITKEGIANEQI